MATRGEATAATRTRLLDAGVEVLSDVGADALTMKLVAERADVALRTVYNHYPSKEALVVEAYDRLAGQVQDAVRALPDTGSPRERLGRFVDAVYDAFAAERLGNAAIMSVTGINEFDSRLREVRAWRRGEITRLLRVAERDGSLQLPLKQAVALAFLSTAWVAYSSLVDESGLSLATAKELARRTLDAALFGTYRENRP